MNNKVAIVTNATKYAGSGAVTALLKKGYTVMCHDESFNDQDILSKFQLNYSGVIVNTGKSPDKLVKDTIKQCGRIDLLVSNDVYPLQYINISEADPADMRAALEKLVVWPFSLLSRVSTEMKNQGKGYIILITSAAPNRPETGFSVYSTARAGASALAKAAARELAPFNISVNAIAPNYFESETYYPPEIWSTDEGREKLKKLLPAGRLGNADEMGELIVFLASGSIDFITGEVINFAGGWS